MNYFGRREERRPEPVRKPARTAKQDVYGKAGYGHSTTNLQPPQQYAVPLQSSPPPPYMAYDNSYLQPTTPYYVPKYESHYQSLQYLPVVPPQRPAYRAYASTTTVDLSRPQTAGGWAQEPAWQSRPALAVRPKSSGQNGCVVARGLNQGVAFCDRVTERLNDMLVRSEDPGFGLQEEETRSALRKTPSLGEEGVLVGANVRSSRARGVEDNKDRPSSGVINWKKTWLYSNSRLPPGMVPFHAYLPTWTLICRAATASLDVYTRPPKGQREYFTDADPRQGTKATIIKSQPVDDRTLIIVSIRGSQFKRVDWLVNFALSPTEPVDAQGNRFLDDRGNACHAGFLECARAMVHPIAEQLKDLIARDPSCAASSLLLTGHSAGGAVATLLYMHMMSRTTKSTELTDIAGVFKRIHCITFGTPPLSLLPLQKPAGIRHEKDVFLSFANEGDLIVRASKPYFASLVKALAASTPTTAKDASRPRLCQRVSRQRLRDDEASRPNAGSGIMPTWPVPEGPLSNAGRLVLLREKPRTKSRKIEACQLTDMDLRKVFFGDPAMHSMALYKQRVDDLAFAAVSGSDLG